MRDIAEPSPRKYIDYRCFGGFGSIVLGGVFGGFGAVMWVRSVCVLFWGRMVLLFCLTNGFGGVGGWVRIGSPCGVELPAVGGVGAVVSRGANRGLVGWKAGV